MANRAYLYFQDNREKFDLNRNEDDYFDSRHQVPFSWLLFFEIPDLVLQPSGHGWDEIFLVAEWESAQPRFEKRMKQFLPLLENKVTAEQVQMFLIALEEVRAC